MAGLLGLVCFCLACLYAAGHEHVTWTDGKCRFKSAFSKHIKSSTGGYFSGFCSANQFYKARRHLCLPCPGNYTNCCENTLPRCLVFDKSKCGWTKEQTPTTTVPVLNKQTTASTLPKDTSGAPCKDTHPGNELNITHHITAGPMTHTTEETLSIPTATQAPQDGHDRQSHTSAPEPQEPSTCIECWVVGGIMLLFLCLVMVFVYREDVVRKFNNLIRSVRERFNCGGSYAPGRIQR